MNFLDGAAIDFRNPYFGQASDIQMKVLLIGAGRMGQRHLRGMKDLVSRVVVVDPEPAAPGIVEALLREHDIGVKASYARELNGVLDGRDIDAAIVASTADHRLDALKWLAERGVKRVLMEKPLAQSRARLEEVIDIAEAAEIDVHCNFYRRYLPAFQPIRERHAGKRQPLHVAVTAGAVGLGCNGMHWIDFAMYLCGANSGKLLFGELQEVPIASGRGPQFRDFGGTGVFAFPDGSRLVLTVIAHSSAGASCVIYESNDATLIDQEDDLIITYTRAPQSNKPAYLYGQDYDRKEVRGAESIDLATVTADWLGHISGAKPKKLVDLHHAAVAHYLLFDLLETSGQTHFPIT